MSVPSKIKAWMRLGVTPSGQIGTDAMTAWGLKKFVGTKQWCTVKVKGPNFQGKINFKYVNGINTNEGFVVRIPGKKFIGVEPAQIAALIEAIVDPSEGVEIVNAKN